MSPPLKTNDYVTTRQHNFYYLIFESLNYILQLRNLTMKKYLYLPTMWISIHQNYTFRDPAQDLKWNKPKCIGKT